MARLPDLIEFAKEHGLKIGTIADLIHYRSHNETLVERSFQNRSRLYMAISRSTPTPTAAPEPFIWR